MLFLPAPVKDVIRAKRDKFPIFRSHMDPASLEPLQVQIPSVLKSHGGEAEAVFPKLTDKAIPLGEFVIVTVAAIALIL